MKTISISSVNVGTYMIGEVDISWKKVEQERHRICEKLILKCVENKVDIICTQEDILLSDYDKEGPYEAEFYELYGKHNYFAISYCAFHENASDVIQKLHPNRNIKLGNVIYIHRSQVYNVIPIPQTFPTHLCIAYCIIHGKIKLANVHLCGGRFDDQLVFQEEDTYIKKLKQIRAIEPSTIICGDMNSTRYIRKPGGLKNWDYPSVLAKTDSLTIDQKMKWETWQCNPIEFLFSHPKIPYRCAFNDEELISIGETTSRGGYIVDWIFYDVNQVKCSESKVIKLYGDYMSNLSDHHMISSTFSINN